jgi:predicted Zn-dependent peptidase
MLLATLLAPCAQAAAQAAAAPLAVTASADAGPVELRLESGLRVWSFPGTSRERFWLTVLVGAGARDEHGFDPGIAHMLQHVLVGAGEGQPAAGAFVPLRWSGRTMHECTLYQVECAAVDWRAAARWVADKLQHPAILFGEVVDARRQVFEEVARRDLRAGEVTWESLLYPGHPLGRAVAADRTGRIETDALRTFFAKYYCAGNMAIGFCGPVPMAECRAEIAQAFSGLRTGGEPPVDPIVHPWVGQGLWAGYPNEPSGWLATGYHLTATDLRECAAVQMLAAYLAQPPERGVGWPTVLSSFAVELHARRDGQRLEFEATVADPLQLEAAVAAVDAAIAGIHAPSANRLAAARADCLAALTAGTSEDLAAAMLQCWLARRRGAALADWLKALDAITAADLTQCAAAQLLPERRYVVSRWPLSRPNVRWFSILLCVLALVALDGLFGFRVLRRVRRALAERGTPAASAAPSRSATTPSAPIRPGDADDLIRGIQKFYDEEQRGRD